MVRLLADAAFCNSLTGNVEKSIERLKEWEAGLKAASEVPQHVRNLADRPKLYSVRPPSPFYKPPTQVQQIGSRTVMRARENPHYFSHLTDRPRSTLKPSCAAARTQMATEVLQLLKSPDRSAILTQGPPGIGKSSMARYVCNRALASSDVCDSAVSKQFEVTVHDDVTVHVRVHVHCYLCLAKLMIRRSHRASISCSQRWLQFNDELAAGEQRVTTLSRIHRRMTGKVVAFVDAEDGALDLLLG